MTIAFNTTDLWTAGEAQVRVLAVYCPNEEQDPWVEFENVNTLARYSCRQEAFLARYQVRLG